MGGSVLDGELDAIDLSGIPVNHMVMEALANRAAKTAVKETFFALGVDTTSPGEVDIMRRSYHLMRDKLIRAERRQELWSKGLMQGFVSIILLGIGYLVNYLFKINASPHS